MGRLGSWEAGKLGSGDLLGGWEVGRLGRTFARSLVTFTQTKQIEGDMPLEVEAFVNRYSKPPNH